MDILMYFFGTNLIVRPLLKSKIYKCIIKLCSPIFYEKKFIKVNKIDKISLHILH